MYETFDIILKVVADEDPVNIAVLFGILLLFFIMVAALSSRLLTAQKSDVLIKSPENIETLTNEPGSGDLKAPSFAVPDKLVKTAILPNSGSQTVLDNGDAPSLEITRELDLSDKPDRLAPEDAFSVEIRQNRADIDPSVIAPKFAVEPIQRHIEEAELSEDSLTAVAEDRISIPRLGSEVNSSDFFVSDQQLTSSEPENAAEMQADKIKKQSASTKTQRHNQNKNEINANTFDRIEPDLRVVTPDEIADAVASLVGGNQAGHAIETSAEASEEAPSNSKVDSQSTLAKERNMGEGVIEEIELLAEVEGKMRALRELFEAGLIAPEVYLLKAREYASKSL